MAIFIRYWLFLVQPLQHDLLLEYDITDWVPPNHPSDVRHDRITSVTPDVVYPQHTRWVPDATQDGDVEPNPGPDSNAPPHGLVRTLTENCERNASGLNTGVQDQGDAMENPDILESTSNPPSEGTTEREPPQNGEPSTPPDQHTDGLSYVPPPPQKDTQAYTFHEDGSNPLDKLPIHTPTEYQLIEELVKLNTGASQQPMTTAEQDTLKASVVYDAQTRLKTYLTKHPNRAVTTEHIRRQTQEGVWYDRNTYPPPPPVPKNHLAQEPTPGSAVKFSHHFFYQGSGFFMFLVDVGQLFRCAGHHFMCVTMGPPIRGDPISHSQAHVCFCTTSSIPCSVP